MSEWIPNLCACVLIIGLAVWTAALYLCRAAGYMDSILGQQEWQEDDNDKS